jgi:alkanesulfonate monooxygenase SsuD/methylene tetrahydromethanopterin reductase-like flavin-dependent oxidoreductase (luciferase family)
MPPVRPPLCPGPLGLIIRPLAPRCWPVDSDPTDGRTPPPTGGTTSWLADVCRSAEGAGAGALWATDHLFWGQPSLECLTSLAVAATATAHATLGTCVLQLPMRSPAAVAKQAATLQILSGGRFVLGVGVGSHAGEYELAGADFATRGADLDRGIEALRAAWATADDPSRRYRQEPAASVPVWVGGSSPAARRRAARTGDGWVPLFVPPARLADELSHLRDEVVAAGRAPAAVTSAVVMMASVGPDARRAAETGTAWLSSLYGIPPKAFERHLVAGSPDYCAEMAGRYLDAGAEHVAVMVADDEPLEQFGALAAAFAAGPSATVSPSPTGSLAGVGA